jgi:hypothetical protein
LTVLRAGLIMLTIRDEQFKVFEAAARKAFEDRMVFLLMLSDESAARELVRLAVRKCLSYGIDTEADMELFLRLMVKYSPDFETRPEMAWALALLEQADLPGGAKTRILMKRLGDPSAAARPLRRTM